MDQQNRFAGPRGRKMLQGIQILLFLTVLASCIQPFQTDELSVLTDENAPMIQVSDEIDDSLFNGSVIVTGSAWDLDGTGAIRSSADPALVPAIHWEVPAFGDSGAITPNADGSFSFVLDTSTYDRDISLVLTATDANGNGLTRTIALRYDSRGPEITVTSPESNSIIDRIVSVRGTVHDVDNPDSTSSVDTVSWSVIGTALGGDVTINSETGSFSFDVDTIGIGTDIAIRIDAVDIQGDVTTQLLRLNQDDIGPDISISSPENYSQYAASVTVTGTITNRPGVAATDEVASASYTALNGTATGPLTLDADGNFSLTIDTTGTNTDIVVTISAEDVHGFSSSESLILVNDGAGPDISISSPENYSQYAASVTVTGTITNRSGVAATDEVASASYAALNGTATGPLTLDANGGFSFTIDTTGTNTDIVVTISAEDVHGSSSSESLILVNDGTGPGISISSPENYSQYAASVTVTGTITNRSGVAATDEVASASYTALNGTATGPLTLDANGGFSLTIDTTGVNDDIVVTISAEDVHGSSSSEFLVLLNDDTGPWITIEAPVSGYYGPLVVLNGSVRNASGDNGLGEVDTTSAIWSIPGTALSGPLTLDGSGEFSANIDATSLTTNIVLEVSVDDRNGNTSTRSVSLLKPTGGGDINVEALVENGEIIFTWNDVTGASSYRMEEGVFGGIRDNITKDVRDEYRWSGLRNGTFHEFQLFATVPGFPDAASTTITVAPMSTRTFVPLVVPSTFGQNHVFWQPSLTSGARYLLERRENGGAWSSVTVTGNTQYIDSDAVKGNTYEYRVTLRNNGSTIHNTSGASSIARPHQYPSTPTFANQFSISSSTIEDAEVSGNTLFVTAGETLFTFDLTDPVNPVERDSLPNVGDFFVISGDYLYGIGDQILSTVDVSDPGSLAILDTVDYTTGLAGSANDHYSLAIDEAGGALDTSVILYVLADRNTDSESGVVVFDVTPGSHASDPNHLGTITGSGGDGAYGHDIAVIDDNIFLSREDDDVGHGTVDISDVGSTSISAIPGAYSLSTNLGWPKRLILGGDTLFVRNVISGFVVFDVSTPSAPSYVAQTGSGAYSGGGMGYDASRDEVILADEYAGGKIMVFDVSDPSSIPVSANYLPEAGSVQDVAVFGGYIYGVGSGGTISILDRTAPVSPASVASVPLTLPVIDGDDSTYIADVAVSGDMAYALGDRGDVWAIDFSTPVAPVVTDAIRATFFFRGLVMRDLFLAGDVLFIGAGAFGVVGIDVSDPGALSAVDYGDSSNRPENITVIGGYLFADSTSNEYLEAYDVSDVTDIRFVDQFSGGGGGGITIDQNYLYVGDSTGPIQVYDITDPVAPIHLQNYTGTSGSLFDLHVSNGYLYAYTSGGTDIIDIRTDRDAIVEAGSIPSVSPQGSWGNAVVEGSFAYVASNDSLDVFDVSNPAGIGPAVGTIPVNAGPVAVSGRYAVVGHRDALQITIIDLGE